MTSCCLPKRIRGRVPFELSVEEWAELGWVERSPLRRREQREPEDVAGPRHGPVGPEAVGVGPTR